jgi:DNA-binding response OmpR family regulator
LLPPRLRHRGLELDRSARWVWRDDRELRLTGKEFAVLETLMAAAGTVVSAERLIERGWDEHLDPFSGIVRVVMVGLRRKLGPPPLIDTVIGAGYRL